MRFEETQFPDWRVCALMLVALAGLLVWRRAPRLPAYVALILVTAGFFECRLATRLDEHAVRIDFGLIPVYSHTIPLADIVRVEAEAVVPASAHASSVAPSTSSSTASSTVPSLASSAPSPTASSAASASTSAPAPLQHVPLAGSPATGSWGWGFRRDRDGTLAITIRGAQGVLLILRDGSRLRIGSQEPGALEQALRHALPTAAPSARCPASAC